MSSQPFEPSPATDPRTSPEVEEVGPDLGHGFEYDLAHEAGVVGPAETPHDAGQREAVVTATPEYDGDYSYDLAHDVPKSR